jgi:hypothetical protein
LFKQEWHRVIARSAGGDAQLVLIEGDGTFYLPLPAGEHVLVGYQRTSQEVGGRRSKT